MAITGNKPRGTNGGRKKLYDGEAVSVRVLLDIDTYQLLPIRNRSRKICEIIRKFYETEPKKII